VRGRRRQGRREREGEREREREREGERERERAREGKGGRKNQHLKHSLLDMHPLEFRNKSPRTERPNPAPIRT
jgi:hypothetical protein